MKEQHDIEELFKQAFDSYEADPGIDAWSNIQSNLGGSASTTGGSAAASSAGTTGASWISTAIVGVIISAVAIGGYFFFNQTAEKNLATKEKTKTQAVDQANESISDQKIESIDQAKKSDNKLSDAAKTEVSETKEGDTNPTLRKKSQKPANETSIVKEKTSNKESSKVVSSSSDKEAEEKQVEAENKITDNSSKIEQTKAQEQSGDEQEFNSATATEQAEDKVENSIEPKEEQKGQDKVDTSSEAKKPETTSIESEKEEEEIMIDVMNVFTPNRDGINDVFRIIETDADQISVKIMTTSGRLIHQWDGVYGYWDGEMQNGTLAPEGVYLYQIVAKKGEKTIPKNGTVKLNY